MNILKTYRFIKLDIYDSFVYLLLILVSQRLSFSSVSIINSILKDGVKLDWSIRQILIYVVLALVPHIFFFVIAPGAAHKQYKRSEDNYLWLKTGLFYTLPAEFIRLCLCSTTIAIGSDLPLKFGMSFAPLNHMIFTNTYGNWSGRYYEVATMDLKDINYIIGDYVAYILCHIIYLIPYMIVTMLIYRLMWRATERELEKMHKATN